MKRLIEKALKMRFVLFWFSLIIVDLLIVCICYVIILLNFAEVGRLLFHLIPLFSGFSLFCYKKRHPKMGDVDRIFGVNVVGSCCFLGGTYSLAKYLVILLS